MAKIVHFHQIGGPEVLKIEEGPSREPGKGEAKLRVQAIGLNRAESRFMHGYYLEPAELPASLGYEAAGVVVGVGAGVDRGWLKKSYFRRFKERWSRTKPQDSTDSLPEMWKGPIPQREASDRVADALRQVAT